MPLNLKEWRRLREKTQTQMAEAIGCSLPTYRDLEEHPEKIQVRTLVKMADILNISIEDFSFLPLNTTKM